MRVLCGRGVTVSCTAQAYRLLCRPGVWHTAVLGGSGPSFALSPARGWQKGGACPGYVWGREGRIGGGRAGRRATSVAGALCGACDRHLVADRIGAGALCIPHPKGGWRHDLVAARVCMGG